MIYLLVVLFIILIVLVIAALIHDRRKIKQKTVESIGDDLWNEIDEERQDSIERGKQFRRTLNNVRKRMLK